MPFMFKFFPSVVLGTSLVSFVPSASSAPSINDMQGCQAIIDFVELKIEKAKSVYPEDDVEVVLTGLEAYDTYIQTTVITPGLLHYAAGDKPKAAALQQQVNVYKQGLVDSLEKRFPQNRLYTDMAISLNDCAKKAVPDGEALESLKSSLLKVVELSKSH